MSVGNVGNPSASAHSLPLISEFTREKSLMNVRCVVKRLRRRLTLHNIRKLTRERNHMNVRSVARPSARRLTSFSIRGFTPERSPISVWSVGKPLVVLPTSPSIRGFTLGSNPMNAKTVEGPLGSSHSLFCITEPIRVRNPAFVKTAGRLLFVVPS